MTSRQAKIQEDTYFRIMRILQENPDLTQRELAKELGVSVGGLNYCLKALMERGWVKVQNFSQSKNKFGYVYILTPGGIAEKAALTSRFLKRKMEEYELLKVEIEALKNEIDAKASAGRMMATRTISDIPLQSTVYEGVPEAAKALIWEIFFRSRGRGISLPAHYPWIEASTGITTILVNAGSGQEPTAVVAALVLKEETLADGTKAGLIGLVCVDQALQGKGLGRRLVSAAVETGRAKALDALALWTNKPDVYAKHGFVVDSRDRYGTVWKRTQNGVAKAFCPDPAGIEVRDISADGVPAFAKSVLVFSTPSASITVLPTMQGYTLAAWDGQWDAIFEILEQVMPDSWNLNAPADSPIHGELGQRDYHSELPSGSLRMVIDLTGSRTGSLPYIPLLNRI